MRPADSTLAPSANPQPLVTFVLPTFRCAALVGGALESLAAQTERDFEVVVSDGASDDGTAAVAESYKARLPLLTVLSRPDKGVYDAINLGVAQSRGRWVHVLGADDRLHAPDTLAQVAQALRRSEAGLVYGDVRVMGTSLMMVADRARYGGAFTLNRLMTVQNICHQAIFTRRELFERLGPYDLRFKFWADWDFAQRAFVREKAEWIDVIVADYAATGMSSSEQDVEFLRTRTWRFLHLWRARPFSMEMPMVLLRLMYWEWRRSKRA